MCRSSRRTFTPRVSLRLDSSFVTLCWGEQMLAWITGCLTDDKVVLSTDIQVLKYMPRGAAGRQASVRKIAIS